jgi:Contractile injection system spike tip protein
MPADFVIVTGDMIKITIPPPCVIPSIQAPVPLKGSSTNLMVGGKFVCLVGDELPQMLQSPLPYTSPPFVTPGTGTLKVMITPANMTTPVTTTNGGKPLLIKGQKFPAIFNVASPAMQPTPAGPVPDPLMAKPGTAEFITTNMTVKAG